MVSAIAAESGLSKADSKKALNAPAEGDSIQLVGFGTFSISEPTACTGRNPRTGKEIQKVAKFKAGKALDTVN